MLNPLAKRLVIPQRPSNTESKVTGVGVHKSGCEATITTMAVNQRQVTLHHLPSLLQNLAKNSVEYDISGMVAVKVDFHFSPPSCWDLAANRVSSEKNSGIITFCSVFSRAGLNSDLVVDGLSQSLLTAEIFFSSLHRDVAQQKLNLFQLAPGAVAEAGTRSSKVMRREFYDSNLACVLLDDMPHHLFG